MNSLTKTVRFVVAAAAFAATSAILFATPAFAGSWSLTGTPTGGDNAGQGMSVSKGASSMSLQDIGVTATSSSISYTGAIKWTGGGTQPSTVTVTEIGAVNGSTQYGIGNTSANDGLGDPPVTTVNTSVPGGSKHTSSSGTHTTVVSVAAGATIHFTRMMTGTASGGGLNQVYTSYSVSLK